MKERISHAKTSVFRQLKDINLFNKVYVSYGVVTWPGDIDLAPDAMYDEIKKNGYWQLT